MRLNHRLRWMFAALLVPGLLILAPGPVARAQQPVTVTVRVDQPAARIDPIFYGLMTEEINFSYDGGLYAELIRNRTFQDDPKIPVNWSVVKDAGAEGAISLDQSPVPNTALTMALNSRPASRPATGGSGRPTEASGATPVNPATRNG